MYQITLTREEYQAASYMSDRGYLGQLTDYGTEEWSDDESAVTISLQEHEMWLILQTIEDDPDAVWSLTSPDTSLGQKFQTLVDSVV